VSRAVVCQACGATFQTTQPMTRYCGTACRIRGNRAKKREARPMLALERAAWALLRAVQAGEEDAVPGLLDAVNDAAKALGQGRD